MARVFLLLPSTAHGLLSESNNNTNINWDINMLLFIVLTLLPVPTFAWIPNYDPVLPPPSEHKHTLPLTPTSDLPPLETGSSHSLG